MRPPDDPSGLRELCITSPMSMPESAIKMTAPRPGRCEYTTER